MNCTDFKTKFAQLETPDPTPDLADHCRNCPSCSAFMAAEKKMFQSFRGLKGCSNPPDMSKKIIGQLAREAPASQPSSNILQTLANLFLPRTPLSSSIFYSLAGLIIFFLCFKIIFKAQELKKTQDSASFGWEFTLEKGGVQGKSLQQLKVPVAIPGNQVIELDSHAEGRLVLKNQAEIRLAGTSFKALANGIYMTSGVAEVQVQPRGALPPFVVETPIGLVTVVGTSFYVELNDQYLVVKVKEGTVKFTNRAMSKLIAANDELTVPRGASGTSSHPTSPTTGSVPSHPSNGSQPTTVPKPDVPPTNE